MSISKHTPIMIQHDGDTWRLLGEGATRDGKTYCHLASTTRGRQQCNGWVPAQMADWIDNNVILSASMQKEEERRRQQSITASCGEKSQRGNAVDVTRRGVGTTAGPAGLLG